MMRDELKKAFTPIPEDCYSALMSAAHSVKEERVVKRKLSVALVFAISLVLIAGVALAVALSLRDMGRRVVQTEQTEGYYEQWPEAEKVSLVNALAELGYTEKTPEIESLLAGTLTAGDASRVADEAVVAFTGLSISEISFMGIMEAAWGQFEHWTKEEQAWYSQLMVDMDLQKSDHTLYVEPTGPITEAQAIAIARREIAKVFEVDETALDVYNVVTSFQVPEGTNPNATQAYWSIEYWVPESMPKESRLFPISFWALIHPETGELREPLDDLAAAMKEHSAKADILEMQNEVAAGLDKNKSTIEGMVAFKQQWEPSVDKLMAACQLEKTELFDPAFLQTVVRLIPMISLPSQAAISIETAIESARKAIMADHGFEEETMNYFTPCVQVYLTPENNSPLYQLMFATRKLSAEDLRENAAATEKAFMEYHDAFTAFFGGFPNVPRAISVCIDAQTGNALGTSEMILYESPADYWSLFYN